MLIRLNTFSVVVLLLFLLQPLTARAGGDTLDGTPENVLQHLENSITEMSEPELILLIDSLFEEPGIPSSLIVKIKEQAAVLREQAPKNQFEEGFALYPANRFYGSWNTRLLFPYTDSLYKCDTTTLLHLGAEVSGAFTFPFSGPVTSRYGWRDSAMHKGIDIDLQRGQQVAAAFDGMVRFAGRSGGYGNVVIVRHYNGLETVYAHLWKIKVKAGDIVLSGGIIGLGGSTGHSTGTHLHFETRFRGVAINPAYFFGLESQQLHAGDFIVKRTRNGYAAFPANAAFHEVRKGDNLTEIGKQYGVSIKQLRSWNDMQGRVRLKAGQLVRVKAPDALTAATLSGY